MGRPVGSKNRAPSHWRKFPPSATERVCLGCGQVKALELFPVQLNGPYGRRARCRECLRPEKNRLATERRRRLRFEALCAYSAGSPSCFCCGETRLPFLTLDHIANDGADHRRSLGSIGVTSTAFNAYLKRVGFPPGLQVACWNCNAARYYSKVCPHVAVHVGGQ